MPHTRRSTGTGTRGTVRWGTRRRTRKDVVLVDARTLCAFEGAGHADALFTWYGAELRAVREVLPELDAGGGGCARRLTRERRLVRLSVAGRVWVARIEDALGAGRVRLGTIASARMAYELAARGDVVHVVAGGRWALALCTRLGVTTVPAVELVRAMSMAGALPSAPARLLAERL